MTSRVVGDVSVGGLPLTLADGYTLENPEDILSRTVRANDTPHPTQHGVVFGIDLLDARKIIFDISVHSDPESFSGLLNSLSSVFAPTDDTVELRFTLYEQGERIMHGRPRNYNVDTQQYGLAKIKAEFVCADPRIYDTSEQTQVLVSDTADPAGLDFPLTFPISFTVTLDSPADSITVVNQGNIAAPYEVWFTASGNPTITHQSGKYLSLVGDLTATSGGIFVLRSIDHSVTFHNDGDPTNNDPGNVANVYSFLAAGSSWFDLVPGGNDLHYTETSGIGTLCVFVHTDTWI